MSYLLEHICLSWQIGQQLLGDIFRIKKQEAVLGSALVDLYIFHPTSAATAALPIDKLHTTI